MASSSCISMCKLRNPYFSSRLKVRLRLQARSQSFRDEGNSSNTVDENMAILRYRMEQVRMRERFNTCYKLGNGWNYRSGYDDVRKKHNMIMMSIELITIVGTSISLVFLSGSLCILLVSLFFHHGQIE